MKIKLSKSQWELIGKKTGWIKEAIGRKTDSDGRPIEFSSNYILKLQWKYIYRDDQPYFFGGGSFSSPEMVELPSEALVFKGVKLETMSYAWNMKYEAIRVR